MKRSALKIRANISNNPEIIKLYKKQRNYNINLSRKVKLKYSQKHIPQDASSKNFLKPLIANITPIFKKEDTSNNTNDRPISILPTNSKIFGRILFNRLQGFLNKFLSPVRCGFRKGYSTQNILIKLLQKL